LQPGARVDAPPVAADPLSGQLGYVEPTANTVMVTRHINPNDISVQGPRYIAIPPLISTPIMTRPVSMVQPVAASPISVTTPPPLASVPFIPMGTPPIAVATQSSQVVLSASGAYVPAFVSPFDGTNVVTASCLTTSVSSFGAAVSAGYSVSSPSVAVPFGSAITTMPRVPVVPPVPSMFRSPMGSSVFPTPSIPAVPPIPLVPPAVSVPSTHFRSPFSGEASSTVYRPGRPGTNGVISKVSEPGRAIIGVCAPNPTGQGPWVVSVGDLASVGTAEAYGWPSGVTGLSEQARGTASAIPNQNPLTDLLSDPATVSSTANSVMGTSSSTVPQSNITTSAIGNYVSPSVGPEIVNGWPINIPPIVDLLGTLGWLMGLPEQARGTA